MFCFYSILITLTACYNVRGKFQILVLMFPQTSQWREKNAFQANIETAPVCCQTQIWIKTKSSVSAPFFIWYNTHYVIPSTLWQYLAVRSYSMWSANDVNFSLSCIFWMFDVAKMGNIYHFLAIINENSFLTSDR